ncbi:MAG: hypothetical protein KBT02_03225 [Treponema sp.]|nr:hypothetical protein [Candidatus Treponema caballi]
MEIIDFNVNGEKCGLLFNLTAYIDICEHFGGIDEMFAELDNEGNTLSHFLRLAAALMKGAKAYAKLNGEELPAYTFEELAAICAPYDFGEIRNKVFEAMSGKANVEIEGSDSKNAKATMGAT